MAEPAEPVLAQRLAVLAALAESVVVVVVVVELDDDVLLGIRLSS
jgi:hypothetical protein